jgi:hypothetical protein
LVGKFGCKRLLHEAITTQPSFGSR